MGCLWGGGDRVRMRVCTPCGAGGVCVRVPGVCLGMVQAERAAARRKGRRSVCVCVCVCGMHTGRVVCGRGTPPPPLPGRSRRLGGLGISVVSRAAGACGWLPRPGGDRTCGFGDGCIAGRGWQEAADGGKQCLSPSLCEAQRPRLFFSSPASTRASRVLVAQLCLTLCDPMDCSPPGSSVRGVLQARVLEWVAMSFSRGSSQPRDQTHVC